MVEGAGLKIQQRAPVTPLTQLVFGTDYDEARLTEYATVLGHAKRQGLAHGEPADYLASTPGGLKGIVTEERRLRRSASGKPQVRRNAPGDGIARRPRELDTRSLAEFLGEGSEFALLVARRPPNDEIVLLGEISEDAPLLERAAKHLIR